MLPILAFDDGAFAPQQSYYFDPAWAEPAESAVGLLWKFARANGLPGHQIVAQLSARPIDPYEGLAASRECIDAMRLAKLLRITRKQGLDSLEHANNLRPLHPVLRHCRACMRYGYHAMVHQFLEASHCPAHGIWLDEACRNCGQFTDFRLSAHTLDAPFDCAHCRRPLVGFRWSSVSPRPLPKYVRVAMTRAFMGLGHTGPRRKSWRLRHRY